MKPLKLLIEYQENAQVKELRECLKASDTALRALQAKYNRLELDYCNEMHVNMELVDICKANGIRFRQGLKLS